MMFAASGAFSVTVAAVVSTPKSPALKVSPPCPVRTVCVAGVPAVVVAGAAVAAGAPVRRSVVAPEGAV